jgi:2-succinyl-5-enolpyruvyl-6-hydroxy-3-cyclohexene-1-carboxylate synthase
MYGFDYQIASNESSLNEGLSHLFSQNEKPSVLEIFTPTRENDTILLNYFKELN